MFDKVSINDLLVSEIQDARLKPSIKLKRLVGLTKPKKIMLTKVCKKKPRRQKRLLRGKRV